MGVPRCWTIAETWAEERPRKAGGWWDHLTWKDCDPSFATLGWGPQNHPLNTCMDGACVFCHFQGRRNGGSFIWMYASPIAEQVAMARWKQPRKQFGSLEQVLFSSFSSVLSAVQLKFLKVDWNREGFSTTPSSRCLLRLPLPKSSRGTASYVMNAMMSCDVNQWPFWAFGIDPNGMRWNHKRPGKGILGQCLQHDGPMPGNGWKDEGTNSTSKVSQHTCGYVYIYS